MNAVVKTDEIQPQAEQKMPGLRALESAKNIEPLLSAELSDQIGRDAVAAFEEDLQSRVEWEKRNETAMKLALQVVETKNYPWPNASNVKFPLVTIAALQFSARAYPSLVKAPDLVRYRVVGEDQDGRKASRATRIGRHMSWQLLDQDEAWEEDTDRKFVVVPIIGCAFKKTYWDHVKEINCSRLVLPQNLVVHYFARSIEECERKTEIFQLYDREIKERVRRGLYSEKTLALPAAAEPSMADKRQGIKPPPQSAFTPRKLLEQHKYLDLDGDGYPEPYIVIVDHASQKTLRIVARFAKVVTEQSVQIEELRKKVVFLSLQKQAKEVQIQALAMSVLPQKPEEAEQKSQEAAAAEPGMRALRVQTLQIDDEIQTLTAQAQQLKKDDQENPKVLSIAALEHYTKYGFIPSPDGGFYDLGLGALLGPVNDSVNTLINQLIDSGTLQNGSQGFIGKGARIQGGEVRFKPFEWKRVNVAGGVLRDSMVPLPLNEPSLVLFQLLSLLINYGEKISSVNDAMSGDNPGQNTPAYNMQAMLEQGLQVYNSIFKRLYRSFRKELRKLYVLNRIYINPVEYYETLDGNFQALQSDYQADEKDVMPAADPNAFSSSENMAKSQFLAQRAATVPGYDPVKVERRLLESMDIPDPQEVFPLDDNGQPTIPPPQNPEIALKAAEEQRRTLEAHSRTQISAAEADSRMAVDESVVALNYSKIKQMDEATAVQTFDALTKRIKANSERVKVIADANKPAPKPKAS